MTDETSMFPLTEARRQSERWTFGPADQAALEERDRQRRAAEYAEMQTRAPVADLAELEASLRDAQPGDAIPVTNDLMAHIQRHPLLAERETTHGNFAATALIAQRFKDVGHNTPNWQSVLTDIQREALDGIFVKIARILSGDPNHPDHWRDIEGGAHLVTEQL